MASGARRPATCDKGIVEVSISMPQAKPTGRRIEITTVTADAAAPTENRWRPRMPVYCCGRGIVIQPTAC